MSAEETATTPGRSGLLRRLRLRAPLGRVAALGIGLAVTTSTLAASSHAANWVVPSSASSGDKAWLDSLVGPVPDTGPPQTSSPGVAVVPFGGNPQVLVLPGAGSGSGGSGSPAAPAGSGPDTGALTGSGIPVRVLQAYVAAAKQTAAIDPSCHLTWSLLAGIGRVETDHGRFGAGIDADGVVSPPIYGPRLNGTNGMPVVRDTDGGRLDADPGSDRAVGPMQFLPGTWAGYGTDADGNGVANPQDVDDAALSAARYLCDGSGDLSTQAGRFKAVFRYNQSTSYVRLVLALADSYASGRAIPVASEPTIPVTPGGRSASVGTPPAVNPDGSSPSGAGSSASTPSATPKTKPSPAPTPSATPTPGPSPAPSTPSPTPTPSPSPTPMPSPTPTPTPTPSPTPTPTPSPTPTPTPSPSPTPTPTPSPSPTPAPSESPSPSGAGSTSASPATSPSPSPSPTPTPTPSPSSTP